MLSLITIVCAALSLSPLPPTHYCGGGRYNQGMKNLGEKKWSWNDCGASQSPVQITDVKFSTDRPKPGDVLTVKVVGNTDVDIEEGAYTTVLLMLGRFEYINKSYDLCDRTRFNTSCPLKAGDQELVNTILIPDAMPVESYYLKFHAYTADNKELGCAEFDVTLSQ